MLMMANHAPWKVVRWNQMIIVDRWSFISSELILMKKWKWWKSKLRAFLDILEKDEMIIKKSDTKQTTIYLLNYDKYQIQETTKRPRADHRQTTTKLPSDTNNNDNNSNNENNDNKYISEFSEKFQEIFETWISHRKEKKKPLTKRAMDMQLKDCREWWEKDSIASIEKSIKSWWTWLFPNEWYDKKKEEKEKAEKDSIKREKDAEIQKRKEEQEFMARRIREQEVESWYMKLPKSERDEIDILAKEHILVKNLSRPLETDSTADKERKQSLINSMIGKARSIIINQKYNSKI